MEEISCVHKIISTAIRRAIWCKLKMYRHFSFIRLTSMMPIVLLLSLVQVSLSSAPCHPHEYWDNQDALCIPCSKCDQQSVVIRPCQQHLDTVCGSFNDLEVDWSWLHHEEEGRVRAEHQKQITRETTSSEELQNSEELLFDWQITMLILAVIACLLFFIATLLFSINYIRQWREIKRHFDADIEQLSEQLMARLSSIPNFEGRSILLEDPTTKNHKLGSKQIEVRCVYLEELLEDGKGFVKQQKKSVDGTGNVYIEEGNDRQHQSWIN